MPNNTIGQPSSANCTALIPYAQMSKARENAAIRGKDEKSIDHVTQLPEELVNNILTFVPIDSLQSVSQVNKHLNTLTLDPQLLRTKARALGLLLPLPPHATRADFVRASQSLATFASYKLEEPVPFNLAESRWSWGWESEARMNYCPDRLNIYVWDLPALPIQPGLEPNGRVDGNRPDLEGFLASYPREDGYLHHYMNSETQRSFRYEGPQPLPMVQTQVATPASLRHQVGIIAWADDMVKIFRVKLTKQRGRRWRSATSIDVAGDIVKMNDGDIRAVRVEGKATAGVILRNSAGSYTYWSVDRSKPKPESETATTADDTSVNG